LWQRGPAQPRYLDGFRCRAANMEYSKADLSLEPPHGFFSAANHFGRSLN
jgi:hypothetical protein